LTWIEEIGRAGGDVKISIFSAASRAAAIRGHALGAEPRIGSIAIPNPAFDPEQRRGQSLWKAGLMYRNTAAKTVDVNSMGDQQLELRACCATMGDRARGLLQNPWQNARRVFLTLEKERWPVSNPWKACLNNVIKGR
jgi:hypothetical protein